MKKSATLLMCFVGLSTAEQTVVAQPAAASDSPAVLGEAKLSSDDQKFLTLAAQWNLAGLESAKLAMQQATRPDVKELATTLAAAHRNGFAELSLLAQRKKKFPPTAMNREQQSHYTRLASEKGVGIDKTFVEQMAELHKSIIELYESAAATASDGEIKTLAAKQLPLLKQHLETARQLKKTLD